MTPIVSDKFAVFSTTHYYMYLISRGALGLRAAGAPRDGGIPGVS